MVTIKLYGPLREVVRQAKLESKDSTTSEILTQLCEQHPRLKPLMFDDAGKFYSHYVILLDGQNVWSLNGLNTPVPDNSLISLVYPIEGG